jgi:hypothetical protein
MTDDATSTPTGPLSDLVRRGDRCVSCRAPLSRMTIYCRGCRLMFCSLECLLDHRRSDHPAPAPADG